ncbi:MAG TPA: SIS domain-containing protein [Fimbriimonas sp.]|nr:SIS domain-containing protein [Fimbriimonas sp.]
MTKGVLMESEIRQQPQILASNSESYFDQLRSILEGKSFDMVLLAARGSSDHAAQYARYLIEVKLGIPVSLCAPSVWTRYKSTIRYQNCLAVGVSQSGSAPDVAEVLTAMRTQGHTTLAITNTADSRITHAAEHTLLLNAGPENSVAATKTYTSSVLAMYQLVRAMGADLQVPDLPTEAWVEEAHDIAARFSGPLNRCAPVFSIGRGYSFATAQETALKLMECALLPCKAYSSADFEHGPKALAGHGSAAISFFGSLAGIQSQGCEILEVHAPLSPEVDMETVFPMWDIVVSQWLALLVARSRGLDPDHARHLNKVTQTL